MRKVILTVMVSCVLLLTGCGESAGELNEKGMGYYKKQEYDKAIVQFEKAAKKEKKNAVYWANLGKASVEAKRYEEAVKPLKNAINNNAENKNELYYWLAKTYFEIKDNDAGVEAVEQYVNCDYDNFDYYFNGYNLLKAYGLGKTADSLINQAKQLKTREPEDYNDMGLVYYYLGEYDIALKNFESAGRQGIKEANLNMGNSYLAMHKYEEALKQYDAYEKETVKTAYLLNQKFQAYFALKDYKSAVSCIEEAVSIADEGEQKAILYNRIIAYEYEQNYAKALSLMEEYLKLYPDDEKAKREYEFLKTR